MPLSNLLFGFSGRIGRLNYFLTSLVTSLILGTIAGFGVAWMMMDFSNPAPWVVIAVVVLLSFYVQAALLTKRIRDIGKGLALVWAFYGTIIVNVILTPMLLASTALQTLSWMLTIFTLGIALYAIFKRGDPGMAPDGLANSSPAVFSGAPAAELAEISTADEIIARALAERKQAQQQATARQTSVPTTRSTPAQGGFGRRQNPAFGTR